MPAMLEQAIFSTAETERAPLGEVAALLTRIADRTPVLIGQEMDQVVLPPTAIQLLHHLAQLLAQGTAVALVPVHRALRTQEAADLLGVSRPHLVGLLERGEIPFTRTGNQRRVRMEDLLTHKARRDAQRREHLDALVRMSEDLDLYDD